MDPWTCLQAAQTGIDAICAARYDRCECSSRRRLDCARALQKMAKRQLAPDLSCDVAYAARLGAVKEHDDSQFR